MIRTEGHGSREIPDVISRARSMLRVIMAHEELGVLGVESLFDLVPPEMKADIARLIHHIQNHLASIEMAGEMLASGNLSRDEIVLIEALRSKCVSEIMEFVRSAGSAPFSSHETEIDVTSLA